jgi:glycosyltransferase involved in cell wall biosynthesis
MSDSQEHDELRTWMKESIKKRIVRLCQAGFVAGSTHTDYLVKLGILKNLIVTGYDVIDNDYFAQNSRAVQTEQAALRKRHQLSDHFFLASNRFVEKKNLPRLFQAFARYRQLTGKGSWQLVLLGDGELRPYFERLLKEYELTEVVLLTGFKQYSDLPVYYGLASVFIHASTTDQWGLVVNEAMACGLPVLVSNRCGCAPDLVQDGVNGFTFDPYDVDELTGLMFKISSGNVDRDAMGAASREIISHWTPKTFATNLLRAAESAMKAPQVPVGILDTLLLKGLLNR